ncbi:MAG: LysR family transcriptional regulator [Proteobacteria bacterium]|nr:LysR family transcriptional regulator [Pseudomonadota bacterium]
MLALTIRHVSETFPHGKSTPLNSALKATKNMAVRYDLQTLKGFLAVADEGSIARAAQRESTVPSALSKRLAELEHACGTALVTRHRRGVSLTPAGVELVAHARRIMDEIALMDSALGDYVSGARGQVRLLANTSAIVQFLPGDIADFLKLHPTIKIDLEERTSDQVQKLVQDGLADIGIMVAHRPVDALVCKPYRMDRLYVMMSAEHPLARHEALRFAETLDYDHVGLPRGSSLCESLLAAAYDAGKPLKLRMQATSFDGIRRMVAAGLGIGILPGGSVLPFCAVEGLVARPLREPWAERQLQVVTRERHTLTRVAALLANHLTLIGSKDPDIAGPTA